MASFFSWIRSAAKAVLQAFKPPKAQPPKTQPPKAQPPKAQPPKAQPPKAQPPKAQRTKTKRVNRLQEITLNRNREAAQTFYAATVNLWNVPEGTTEAKRNELIVEKLGVSDLKEAFDLVMSRFTELRNQLGDDSVSPPLALTQLQTELAARVSGYERL